MSYAIRQRGHQWWAVPVNSEGQTYWPGRRQQAEAFQVIEATAASTEQEARQLLAAWTARSAELAAA